MHRIRLTQHEAAIMGWLLATPLGKKARGFTIVRKGKSTSLEVTDADDLDTLVHGVLIMGFTDLGWKEPSVISLRRKVHAADVKLGEQR